MTSTPDPYSDLARAYHHLVRRPPAWTTEFAAVCGPGVEGVVEAIRADCSDHAQSDATIRTLASRARLDPTAATVLLHALAPTLRLRLSRAATAQYRADALTELAIVILENNLGGEGLARRLVNRAHTRTYKHEHRIRHHGTTDPKIVDPCPADRLTDLRDRQTAVTDIASGVADRVDLERFVASAVALVATGSMTAGSWQALVDHRLTGALTGSGRTAPTRQRVAAHRAVRRLAPLVSRHLSLHAA